MFCDPVYLTNKRALTLVINEKHSLDLPKKKSERFRNLRKNRICDLNSVIRRIILLVTEQSQMINDVQQTVRLRSHRVWFAVWIPSRLSVHQPGYMAAVADARPSISHWQCGKNGSGATFSAYHVLGALYSNSWPTMTSYTTIVTNFNSWSTNRSHFVMKL